MKGLRCRKGNYYGEFYDPAKTPTRREFPLRTRDRREAEQIYLRLRREYALGTFDPWSDQRPGRILLDEAIRAFLKTREGLAKQTQAAYASSLGLFLKRSRVTSADGITARSVLAFIQSRDYTVKTQNSHLQRLETFVRWLIEEGYCTDNPVTKVRKELRQGSRRRRQAAKPRRDFLMPDDLRAIQAHMQEDEHDQVLEGGGRRLNRRHVRAMAELAICTGLRISSLCRLNHGDVRLRHVPTKQGTQPLAGQLTARATKSGDDLLVPLTPRAALILHEWISHAPDENPERPVFFGPRLRRRLDPRTVSTHFSAYRDEAGLRKSLTFHATRHTFVSWALMLGLPVYTVKELAGHADTAMTEQYAHMVRRYLMGQARTIAADILGFYCPGVERDRLERVVAGTAGAGLAGYAFGGSGLLDVLFGAALYRQDGERERLPEMHV